MLFAKNKGYLWGTHVVVGLPECLAEASKEPHAIPIMQHTRAVAVDEVDACFLVTVLLPGSYATVPTCAGLPLEHFLSIASAGVVCFADLTRPELQLAIL